MTLYYRGIPYERKSLDVPTVATQNIGTYRGASYPMTRVAVNLDIPNKSGIVYRGISDKSTTIRFLGRQYSYSPLTIRSLTVN